jgi:hypothetical protein
MTGVAVVVRLLRSSSVASIGAGCLGKVQCLWASSSRCESQLAVGLALSLD